MTREQVLQLFRNSGIEYYVKKENGVDEARRHNLMTVRFWVDEEDDQDANEGH